ncbi:hypothetical protein B0H11DRAFT_1903985 [Mycena galericulata]|nr:hypothetical protein B0H11DRAFT_1903985 [Mycena galericulata]
MCLIQCVSPSALYDKPCTRCAQRGLPCEFVPVWSQLGHSDDDSSARPSTPTSGSESSSPLIYARNEVPEIAPPSAGTSSPLLLAALHRRGSGRNINSISKSTTPGFHPAPLTSSLTWNTSRLTGGPLGRPPFHQVPGAISSTNNTSYPKFSLECLSLITIITDSIYDKVAMEVGAVASFLRGRVFGARIADASRPYSIYVRRVLFKKRRRPENEISHVAS